MKYKAIWNDKTIAEADAEKLLFIEGNVYFPPEAVDQSLLTHSDHHTTCPWKGLAHYYNVKVGEEVNENAAWYYPVPKEGSVEIVGKDFANYVAFWNGVEVKQEE